MFEYQLTYYYSRRIFSIFSILLILKHFWFIQFSGSMPLPMKICCLWYGGHAIYQIWSWWRTDQDIQELEVMKHPAGIYRERVVQTQKRKQVARSWRNQGLVYVLFVFLDLNSQTHCKGEHQSKTIPIP
jgi:hypothetical protein